MKDTTKKSLTECRKDTAEAYGYESWQHLQKQLIFRNEDVETFLQRVDEAAELYASQFVKKYEAVSSDVEQAAESFASENNEQYTEDCPSEWLENTWSDAKAGFIEGAKWQSTQQPATINWFSEAELSELFNGYNSHYYLEAKKFQSKLKERVNCVDVVQLSKIRDEMYNSMPVGAGLGVFDIVKAVNIHLNKLDNFIDNLTSKTKDNGQAK